MYNLLMVKNIISIVNILLIMHLLKSNKDNQAYNAKNIFLYLIYVGGLYGIRVIENSVSIHIVYNYITLIIMVILIGYLIYKHNLIYCLLMGSIFLTVILLGQLISCFIWYSKDGCLVLAHLPEQDQIGMVVVAEIVILIVSLMIENIVKKIPSFLKGLNAITIFIPLFVNIVVLGIFADQLYTEKDMIIGSIWSVLTVLGACVMMFVGAICNIMVLENYLNVKKIEHEKQLQISEMSMQYDYYMKQSKDMENIRRLAHDIKNHLEALKENIDENQKIGYISGIEGELKRYQSYYKTGNPFIDNVLHAKRLEAIESGIEFKVFADFSEFINIKNEDLCVIISNIIDNALRECLLMKADEQDGECLIQLRARKVKGFLSVICENSLRECQIELLKGKQEFESTKDDKKNHGFGLKNVKRVVLNYEGEMSVNVLGEMFCVSIIIPVNF